MLETHSCYHPISVHRDLARAAWSKRESHKNRIKFMRVGAEVKDAYLKRYYLRLFSFREAHNPISILIHTHPRGRHQPVWESGSGTLAHCWFPLPHIKD